ncbi:MAG: hypothetical protein ACI8Q9_001810, partial [Planctomycetota bacterium]
DGGGTTFRLGYSTHPSSPTEAEWAKKAVSLEG